MVKNKVYFINHKLRGNSHEIIDVSLIVMLAKVFSAVEIHLSVTRTTILSDLCQRYLSKKNRTDLAEKMSWYSSKLDITSLFLMDIFVALKDAWLMIKGDRDALYLFSYGNSRFSIHLVNFLAKLTRKNVLICAHNELDVLLKENYSIRSNWHYLINRFYRKTRWSDHTKILVLGDFIIDKLRGVLPEERVTHFISLDHPYFQTDDQEQMMVDSKEDNKINIGLVGSVEPGSSMDNLMDFSSLIEGTNIYLNIITRMYVESPQLKGRKNVKFLNPDNIRLSREQYDSLIAKMNYLYYPHAVDRFQFSASGSIFEAVTKGKPAIVYANPNFAYLFKKYGSFGYLVNNTEEIKYILPQLSSTNYQDMIRVGNRMMEMLDPLSMELKL